MKKQVLHSSLVLLLLIASTGCGEKSNEMSVQVSEVREIEEVTVSTLNIDKIIVRGDIAEVKIAGVLPTACHMFDRALLERSSENTIEIKVYATVPFAGCNEPESHPGYDDIIYIDKLPIGYYSIKAKGIDDINFTVIPDIDSGGACATVSVPIEITELTKNMPTPGETALKGSMLSSNICIVPYRVTTSFRGDTLEVSAVAYDCCSRSNNCIDMQVATPFNYKIIDPALGTYKISFKNDKSVISTVEELESVTVMSSDDCYISPARLASVSFSETGFVGSELNVLFKGVFAQGNSLSPLKKMPMGNVTQYTLNERKCPNAPIGGEVLLDLSIEDTIIPTEVGVESIVVNGEEEGEINILPECETIDGKFTTMRISSDIMADKERIFDDSDIINILLTGELKNSCDNLVTVEMEQDGSEFVLTPVIKRCVTSQCKSKKAEYHLEYSIWGLSKGAFVIDCGEAGKADITVQ